MRELTGMTCTIELPLTGKTNEFPFHKGGNQGGVETPDEWRILLEYFLEPVVFKWAHFEMGFSLRDEKD